MTKGRIIILSGPSGAGKTTLHDYVLNCPRFKGKIVKSISVTTRARRPGEVSGRDYIFVNDKMFQYKIRARHFLEWEKVFHAFYGTPARNVQELIRKGKNVLLCIDVKGARTIWQNDKSALRIFVKPPDLTELKSRLMKRGTETPQSLKIRLQTAMDELKQSSDYDHIIINDNLKASCRRLEAVLQEEIGLK